MALSRHFSESHGNVNKPPIHEAYAVTFVEEPNSLSLDFCEDKWYHKLNAQINIKNMILPRVRLKKKFVSFCGALMCFNFRGQCACVFVLVSRRISIVPAETWLLQRPNAR